MLKFNDLPFKSLKSMELKRTIDFKFTILVMENICDANVFESD